MGLRNPTGTVRKIGKIEAVIGIALSVLTPQGQSEIAKLKLEILKLKEEIGNKDSDSNIKNACEPNDTNNKEE